MADLAEMRTSVTCRLAYDQREAWKRRFRNVTSTDRVTQPAGLRRGLEAWKGCQLTTLIRAALQRSLPASGPGGARQGAGTRS
jgi:hypothetical protein